MLLPLDEVPVHVPLRRPRPLRFERLPVPVWNPYSRGRLGPAKSEDPKGGEGKVDANLTNFLSSDAAGGTPTRPPRPGQAPPPPPPPPENLLLRLHRKLPSAPPASTQEVRNPKIGQQLGAQPTPRFRGMIEALLEALLDALLDAMFDPLPPFTFCCPQAIVDQDEEVSIPNISLLSLDEVLVLVPLRRPPPFALRKAPSASV